MCVYVVIDVTLKGIISRFFCVVQPNVLKTHTNLTVGETVPEQIYAMYKIISNGCIVVITFSFGIAILFVLYV